MFPSYFLEPSSRLHVVLTLFIGGLLGIFFFFNKRIQKQKRIRKAQSQVNDIQNYTTVPLLPVDENMLPVQGISTLTFFQGNSKKAELWVQKRVQEIVNSNLWLAGRLVSNSNGTSSICYPKILTADAFKNYHYSVIDNQSLGVSSSFDEINKILNDYLVKKGQVCLDSNETLFRVVFINITDNSFALSVSMSHCLGDGSSYYKVYSMISYKQSVEQLSFTRNTENDQAVRKYFRSTELILSYSFFFRVVLNVMFPSKNFKCFICDTNQQWIETEKQSDPSSKHQFVSTNDILVSWFFKFAKLDFGFMAFNLRQRLPGAESLSTNCVGNYLSLMLYLSKDAQSPQQIRKSLSFVSSTAAPGFRSESDEMPSLPALMRLNCCLITNWSTFFQEIVFPDGAKMLYHTPIFNFGNNRPRFPSAVVIFRSRKDMLSVLIASSTSSVIESVKNGEGPLINVKAFQ